MGTQRPVFGKRPSGVTFQQGPPKSEHYTAYGLTKSKSSTEFCVLLKQANAVIKDNNVQHFTSAVNICDECTVTECRDVSTRLSQPRSTPTASRGSPQSSVSSTADHLFNDRTQPALVASKLNHQLSHRSINGCILPDNPNSKAADQKQAAVDETSHRKVSAIRTPQSIRVRKAIDNVTDAMKPRATQTKKMQSLPTDQSITPTLSGGSTTLIPRQRHAATSSNDEVTIVHHKPTVSSNNTNVSMRLDTVGSGQAKDKNTIRTSRLMKPRTTATQCTRNASYTGCN